MQKPDFSIESTLLPQYDVIAGIDEAGRGALAGPVVAAAVIIGNTKIDDLDINDSKKLSIKKREAIYSELMNREINYGVGIVDNHTIDEIDILNATNLAFQRAIDNLKTKPDYLLVDGNCYRNKGIEYQLVVKGDSRSLSIATASIIAKVTRDNLMTEFAQSYPEYDFTKNKGYGTKKHFDMLKKNGISDIHRKTFLIKFAYRESELFAEF